MWKAQSVSLASVMSLKAGAYCLRGEESSETPTLPTQWVQVRQLRPLQAALWHLGGEGPSSHLGQPLRKPPVSLKPRDLRLSDFLGFA